MDDGNKEVARLRAIGEWMREVGASELSLGDLHIKLSPRSAQPMAREPIDPDEAEELSDEESSAAAARNEEAKHIEMWRRLTRSSGAPIPPFKPKRVA